MEQMIFSQIDSQSLISQIVEQVTAKVLEIVQSNEADTEQPFNVFDDYIPKTEVRGKLASNSTLWSWEKKGKLKLYAIGGKRFYKRSDIEALFTEVKQKGVLK
jgi:peptidoglycan hydrolase-like amidase